MINKLIISSVCLAALSGCASNFTSITPAEKDGQYYVTEITATFPATTSELYLCEAQSNQRMTCEEID